MNEDISNTERWLLDDILTQVPVPLTAFRHVLTCNGGILLPLLCDALGAQIGRLNRPPRFDLDGTPYTGPDHSQDPDWFRRIWSMPENQHHARTSMKQDYEEVHMIVPLDRVERVLDEYVGRRDRDELAPEECVDWLVSHRHLTSWMIVLLHSEEITITPLLFISEDVMTIQKVTQTVSKVAPRSLLSMWAGTETTSKQDPVTKSVKNRY